MTIKELEKLYPSKKYNWIARKDGFPNWTYHDDDIVIKYEEREVEVKDITKALFGKGPIEIKKEKQLVVEWRRA